jgi:hypothetical protein
MVGVQTFLEMFSRRLFLFSGIFCKRRSANLVFRVAEVLCLRARSAQKFPVLHGKANALGRNWIDDDPLAVISHSLAEGE